METELININDNIENLFVAKKNIEDYLIDNGDITEKMTINKFIEYLRIADNAFVNHIQDIIIPFTIINTNKTRYIFNVCNSEDESKILSSALSSIEYDISKLNKVSITDIFNNKLSNKDFFIIKKNYYII